MTDRLRIFEEFHSKIGERTLDDIGEFLGAEDAVESYRTEASERDGIRIGVTLKKFSFLTAKDIFLRLSEFMRHSYYNVYTSEETKEGVRYLFLTGAEGLDGMKMEIIIDGRMAD